MEKKKELGGDYVHEQIKEAPYCNKLQRVVKLLLCKKCNEYCLDISGCLKYKKLHYFLYLCSNEGFIRLC